MSNSNFGELVQCSPRARSAWRWAKSIGAMTVIVGGTFWCGATTGYWVGVANERERSQEEVERLQTAYGLRLDLLTGKTQAAADSARDAADAAVGSSAAVEQAATEVQAAALRAQQAVKSVQRASTGKHAAPDAP
ncbi:hypothetical protein HS961_07115 [Comamonas piscis]|uniref:Uncharacterized protein n=1 Tax=Comamonas piscis TaxID=1562974 RepID=A0A7G5EF52_9BURK|nr:hypothetical protein [Comamonas piscis]QMV72627.1 hypothetical protein HS961_07115 [Comamonas piscis]WSO35394.1 hypothetical protein VUJ63_07135 [Comamonas piscis]